MICTISISIVLYGTLKESVVVLRYVFAVKYAGFAGEQYYLLFAIYSCVSIDPMNLQQKKRLRARHSQNDVSVSLII